MYDGRQKGREAVGGLVRGKGSFYETLRSHRQGGLAEAFGSFLLHQADHRSSIGFLE